MEDLNAAFKDVQLAVHELLKKYSGLKKENEQLQKLNNELNKLVSEKQKLIDISEEKIVTNNISAAYTKEEKALLQSRIDSYLKDIEKCLSLLNA